MKLTVIIRDPSPLIFMGESVAHRRVTLDLTPEQIAALKLNHVGTSGTVQHYEEISMCFIEPPTT